jgi:hypothetical protein
MFDDWKSWFHFLLGIVVGFFRLLYSGFATVLFIIFILYQVFESESKQELLCDFAEFCYGFVVGVFFADCWWLISNLSI